jgi:hypothetical protein
MLEEGNILSTDVMVQKLGRRLVQAVDFRPLLAGHPRDGSLRSMAVAAEVPEGLLEDLEPWIDPRSVGKLRWNRSLELGRHPQNLIGGRCLL